MKPTPNTCRKRSNNREVVSSYLIGLLMWLAASGSGLPLARCTSPVASWPFADPVSGVVPSPDGVLLHRWQRRLHRVRGGAFELLFLSFVWLGALRCVVVWRHFPVLTPDVVVLCMCGVFTSVQMERLMDIVTKRFKAVTVIKLRRHPDAWPKLAHAIHCNLGCV